MAWCVSVCVCMSVYVIMARTQTTYTHTHWHTHMWLPSCIGSKVLECVVPQTMRRTFFGAAIFGCVQNAHFPAASFALESVPSVSSSTLDSYKYNIRWAVTTFLTRPQTSRSVVLSRCHTCVHIFRVFVFSGSSVAVLLLEYANRFCGSTIVLYVCQMFIMTSLFTENLTQHCGIPLNDATALWKCVTYFRWK